MGTIESPKQNGNDREMVTPQQFIQELKMARGKVNAMVRLNLGKAGIMDVPLESFDTYAESIASFHFPVHIRNVISEASDRKLNNRKVLLADEIDKMMLLGELGSVPDDDDDEEVTKGVS